MRRSREQPGVNGVRHVARTHARYYTSTSQQWFVRVKVDPGTFEPADLPEFVAGGREWDDFVIEEDRCVAYATAPRENTIDRVRLASDGNREGRPVVASEPVSELLVGPSSAAWRRGAGDYARAAYVTTDGGTAAPRDATYRTAKVVLIEMY